MKGFMFILACKAEEIFFIKTSGRKSFPASPALEIH